MAGPQPLQGQDRVHVPQLLGGGGVQEQGLRVGPDHGGAPPVPLQGQELGEKFPGKNTGVAPPAVAAQGHDPVRVAQEAAQGPGHRLPPQQRLVGDQEHGPVHIPQGCEAQADGVAGAPVRAVVDHHLEPTAPGQGLHLRVLGHYHGGAEQLRRHRVQGPPDQAPALQLRQELVGAEPHPVPRRHHHAADPRRHAVTPFPGGGA